MHSTPHPNQVRSACQRCRKQKLRCSRQTASSHNDTGAGAHVPSEPCERCARMNLECVAGAQGRVGRPTKTMREVTPVRSRRPRVPASEPTTVQCSRDNQSVLSPTDSAYGLDFSGVNVSSAGSAPIDWTLDHNSPFLLPLDNETLTLFSDPSLVPNPPVPRGISPSGSDFSFAVGSQDPTFAALSAINVRLYGAWESFGQFAKGISLDSLILGVCPLGFDGENGSSDSTNAPAPMPIDVGALKTLIEVSQEYLSIVKGLRRDLGLNIRRPDDHSTHRSNALATANSNTNKIRLLLDSPTAFLVISCFCQMSRLLEVTYTMINAHLHGLQGRSTPPLCISFAGAPLLDFSSQATVFTELVYSLFRQIVLVLGVPGGAWPTPTSWEGLLAEARYREMLNSELGSVEGLWSTQPGRVMGMMETSKELVFMHSMAEYT